jgi:hypothetical protein
MEASPLFIGLHPASQTGSLIEAYGRALLHSFLVATLIGRDVYAQPNNEAGLLFQALQLVLGPLLLGLMALAIRRRFQR